MIVHSLFTGLLALWLAGGAYVQAVTVYGLQGAQQTLGGSSGTSTAANAAYTAPAFNTVILEAPPIPSPAIPTQFGLQLQASASNVVGLSIPQTGAFLGFSIEFSVVNQVGQCAPGSSCLHGECMIADGLLVIVVVDSWHQFVSGLAITRSVVSR